MVPENLKKQLALAVRSIHWSYAIYWSISATHTRTLTWADGYYNGDVRTRKTNQAVDVDTDLMGLSRSQQLRELYESLSAEETNSQAIRPLTTLSPEDLSDTEWYYLVSMSFTFSIGQGLPGTSKQSGRTNWLCDAGNADSQTFSRSLLAKSASIQTVVCFPFMEGVVELGMTELVSEDLNLIQYIKTILKSEYHISTEKFTTGYTLDKKINEAKRCEEQEIMSPLEIPDGFEFNQQTENAYQTEGPRKEVTNAKSWAFMDTKLSNSMSINDYLHPEKVVSVPNKEQPDDMHYQNMLSSLFKTSHQLIMGPQFQNFNSISNFMSWKKPDSAKCQKLRLRTPQKLLKKILFEVPRMYGDHFSKFSEDNGNKDVVSKPEADGMLVEQKWRTELHERLTVLGSMLPSIHKKGKISILDDTIAYIRKLQERVKVCKSCSELTNSEVKLKRKFQLEEPTGTTSINYGNYKTGNGLKSLLHKRKTSEMEMEPSIDHPATSDSSADCVNVKTNRDQYEVCMEGGSLYKNHRCIKPSPFRFSLDSIIH